MRFTEVPEEKWPKPDLKPPLRVLVNDRFLVQIIMERGFVRMTVNSTKIARVDMGSPIWNDGITWDDLQEIKNSVGYSQHWMIEIYPPDDQLINVANMRHLWLCHEAPECAWQKSK